MKALVIYESMYGNTHAVAEAIGRGLARRGDVSVLPVAEAGDEALAGADLVVVGGPTHAHGMSRPSSRRAAVDQARDLTVDPSARGVGLREWFDGLGVGHGRAAAFDTRAAVAPAFVTGQASKGIAKRLRQHGWEVVRAPESFLVDKENHLEPGEDRRAEEWGARLADAGMERR